MAIKRKVSELQNLLYLLFVINVMSVLDLPNTLFAMTHKAAFHTTKKKALEYIITHLDTIGENIGTKLANQLFDYRTTDTTPPGKVITFLLKDNQVSKENLFDPKPKDHVALPAFAGLALIKFQQSSTLK